MEDPNFLLAQFIADELTQLERLAKELKLDNAHYLIGAARLVIDENIFGIAESGTIHN